MVDDNRSQRRDEIAAVAAKLIKQQGHFKFSFNELGKLCGIPAGTLYRSFASKSDLLIYIFNKVVNAQLVVLNQLAKLPLTAKEKMVCYACFPYYYRSVNRDNLGLAFSGANNVLLRAADSQLQAELTGTFQALFDGRWQWFASFVEGDAVRSSKSQLRRVYKHLTVFSRGAAVMGGHQYVPEDEYSLDDMMEFALDILAPLEFRQDHGRVEKHQVMVALRTMSDTSDEL